MFALITNLLLAGMVSLVRFHSLISIASFPLPLSALLSYSLSLSSTIAPHSCWKTSFFHDQINFMLLLIPDTCMYMYPSTKNGISKAPQRVFFAIDDTVYALQEVASGIGGQVQTFLITLTKQGESTEFSKAAVRSLATGRISLYSNFKSRSSLAM